MLKATRSDRPPVAKKEIRKKSNNTQRPKNFNSGYFKKYILYVVIFVLLLFFSFIFFAPMFINLKVFNSSPFPDYLCQINVLIQIC